MLTLVGRWILILPTLNEFEELLCTPFLKQAHEGAAYSLHLRAWNLGDAAVPVDVTTRDLLEFEISRHVSVHEDLRHLPRCDDELRDEIHCIITVATEVRRGLFPFLKLSEQLVR